MKSIIFGLVIALMLGSAGVEAKTLQGAESAKIGVQKEKRFSRSKLSIRFLEVVEDSRCPTDTQCIWAGNAKIKVRVKKNGRAAKTLELNSFEANEKVFFAGYEIKLLDLKPYPATNIRINRLGYIATIEVKKRGS